MHNIVCYIFVVNNDYIDIFVLCNMHNVCKYFLFIFYIIYGGNVTL